MAPHGDLSKEKNIRLIMFAIFLIKKKKAFKSLSTNFSTQNKALPIVLGILRNQRVNWNPQKKKLIKEVNSVLCWYFLWNVFMLYDCSSFPERSVQNKKNELFLYCLKLLMETWLRLLKKKDSIQCWTTFLFSLQSSSRLFYPAQNFNHSLSFFYQYSMSPCYP